MKTSIVIASASALALASAAAMVAPSAVARPDPAQAKPAAPQPPVMTAVSPPPVTSRAVPHPAPMPGGMISHSSSPGAVIYHGPSLPTPPIVAIPRIPGPADMIVGTGVGGEVRTIASYPSNEACDAALPTARRHSPAAVCVSTTPPPPEPELGLLAVIAGEELVALTPFPSMKACEAARAALPSKPNHRAVCTDRFH